MRHNPTRRESMGHWLRLLPLPALLRQAPPACAAVPWRSAVTIVLSKTLWVSLGGRRGGVALVGLDATASPVFTPHPQGPKDSILDATQTLWRPGSLVKPFLLETLSPKS